MHAIIVHWTGRTETLCVVQGKPINRVIGQMSTSGEYPSSCSVVQMSDCPGRNGACAVDLPVEQRENGGLQGYQAEQGVGLSL